MAACYKQLMAAVLLPGLLPGIAAAQERNAPTLPVLEELTIVGSRSDGSLTAGGLNEARERLGRAPGGTAVVDAGSYLDRRVATFTDALGFAPGVFSQPRFGSDEARLSIRGSGIQRTFHLRGVRLLQDGIPVTLADGSSDFQALEPLAARFVEVYRGANALQYGAADLGGAINFVSATGRNAPAWQVRVEGGEFGYRRGQAAAASSHEAHDYLVSFSAYGQDGYRDHSRQETYRLFANHGYAFGPDLETRTYLTHVHTRSELPGNLTWAELETEPTRAAPVNVDNDYRRDFELTRLSNHTAWRLSETRRLDFSIFGARKRLDHPIFQVLRQTSADAGLDVRYQAEGSFLGRRNLVFAGFSALSGKLSDHRFVNAGGTPGARTRHYEQRANSTAVFFENQLYVVERLALVAGGQLVRASRRSDDNLASNGVDESFSLSYRRASPKLGIRFDANQDVQIFANVSRSFEPPSFGELSGAPDATPVDAQAATTLEAGVRVGSESLNVDVALYDARLRNELLSLTDALGEPLGTVNAERTRHRGVEAAVHWQAAPRAAFNAAYLWNDFRFDGDPVYGDNRLAGIPPQLLRAELRLGGEKIHIAPNVEWVGQDYAVDHANTLHAAGYAIWGLRVGGRWAEQVDWFVEGRNLGDRIHAATTGVIADAGGADSRQFLPGDGRAVYAGFHWRR